jgi:hypothetical protein
MSRAFALSPPFFCVLWLTEVCSVAQTVPPCANCNGPWHDSYGYTWQIGTGPNLTGSQSGPLCGVTYTWTASGTYNSSTGNFTVTSSNPQPPTPPPNCVLAQVVHL